jgi:DNA mismatch repair protein MutL
MPRIRLLPDPLISQIAAGEVVERPASVVKELVENALDAGATQIDVELERGGIELVRVSDNGCGMDRDDALLAFDRHATSKIREAADLERIGTLGFRGEALASIAAVADVQLETAPEGEAGTRVRIAGGQVRAVEPVVRDRGTTVQVERLFFNVPARRKFLKTAETELRRAVESLESYALSFPEVGFTLRQGKRTLLRLPISVNTGTFPRQIVRERLGRVFGTELASSVVFFESTSFEMSPGASACLWGFLGAVEVSASRRAWLFVNRRWVRDRKLLQIFYRTVQQEWKTESYPFLVLFVDLPPTEVDVNVHPQKSEVRFRSAAVFAHLEATLVRALRDARRVPEIRPRVGSLFRAFGDPKPVESWVRESSEAVSPITANSGWTSHVVRETPGRLALPLFAPLERKPVPLTGKAGTPGTFRLLAQYRGSILILEGPEGLFLVDQHAAHERVLFERFRRGLGCSEVPRQMRLEALVFELSVSERLALEAREAELEALGFELSFPGERHVAVRANPAGVEEEALRGLLQRAAANPDSTVLGLRQALCDAWAASMACRAAIKIHHLLSPDALEALVSELFAAEDPWACPHGRPTVLSISDAELERRFGRR